MTHEEIVRRTGISKERVRQIEQQALWKLKHLLAARGINKENGVPD
jgi:DNA-directed RNA polymerase sigma subunit (sigma70/sigma32)